MKEFELGDFLRYLVQYEFEPSPGIIAAVTIFLLLVLVYGLRKRSVHPVSAETPLNSQKTPVTKTHYPNIPQDSVLRRHYLSHLRYMIETVTSPRPVDSVLRRHYEQLIASELDACLCDDAKMERLIRRYEEHQRNAMRS
jgi:hypothetical protein